MKLGYVGTGIMPYAIKVHAFFEYPVKIELGIKNPFCSYLG
jgi:hypothetical protein